MSKQRTTVSPATVHTLQDVLGHQVYLGCVAHMGDESPPEYASMWDAFARQMFAYGVEPTSDEPAYTATEDGQVRDHYLLRLIGSDT